jgi:L-serine/L-threonine ammonia-lyase
MLEKIRSYGAIVHMTSSGNECYEKALAMSTENPQWALIHPHENPEVWNGYSEMIAEIKADLPKGSVPSCIVASVGGGGLLMGILKGIDLNGWRAVPVVAMETIGADNFSKSLKAGKLILNDPMTSVAKTLGAPYITSHLIDLAKHFNVISSTLPDERAVEACLKFSDDHVFLVEPAAGVSLATVYSNLLPQILAQKGFNISTGPVVIIVCGGNDINAEILMKLAKDLEIVAL